MSAQLIVCGRPDFADKRFGVTRLRRFAPYVYSLRGGMLVHRVAEVEAHWYEAKGDYLERLNSPRLVYTAVCGQVFYGNAGAWKRKQAPRSQVCALPRPGAVQCGRCNGTGPVFGRGLAEMSVKRRDARRRIGCAAEAE